LRQRLEAIQPEYNAHKMNAAQMFQHCQYPIQTALESENIYETQLARKGFFKRMMYSSKLKKNVPTQEV
jgi:hypothetical protein